MLKTKNDFMKAEKKTEKFLGAIEKGYKTSIGSVDINWKATGGPKVWLGNYKLHNILNLRKHFLDITEFVIKQEDLRQRHKWDIMRNIKAHWYDGLDSRGKYLVKGVISGNLSIYQLSSSQLSHLDCTICYDRPTEEQISDDLRTYNGYQWGHFYELEEAKKEAREKVHQAKELLENQHQKIAR